MAILIVVDMAKRLTERGIFCKEEKGARKRKAPLRSPLQPRGLGRILQGSESPA